jgi:hypothetical protein
MGLFFVEFVDETVFASEIAFAGNPCCQFLKFEQLIKRFLSPSVSEV